jgi:NAD-dependent DNA ligase
MQDRQKTFHRLVSALDELISQEAATVAEHDYEAVRNIQQRVEPVVHAIAELGQEVADEVARARVAALLARRQHSIDVIECQLATARAELMAVQESTSRVSRIGPVYGQPKNAARSARFLAAG